MGGHKNLGYCASLNKWVTKDSRGNIGLANEQRWSNIPLVGSDLIVSNNTRIDIDKPQPADETINPAKLNPVLPKFVDLIISTYSANLWVGGSSSTPWARRPYEYRNMIIYPDYSGGVKKIGTFVSTPCFKINDYYVQNGGDFISGSDVSGTDEDWVHIGYQSFVSTDTNNLGFGSSGGCSNSSNTSVVGTGGEVGVLQATAIPYPNSMQQPPVAEVGQPNLGLTGGNRFTIAASLGIASPGVQNVGTPSYSTLERVNTYYRLAILNGTSTLEAQYEVFTDTVVCSSAGAASNTTSASVSNQEEDAFAAWFTGETASTSYTTGVLYGGNVCAVGSSGVINCVAVPDINYSSSDGSWNRYTSFFFDTNPDPGPSNTDFIYATSQNGVEGRHYEDEYSTYGELYDGSTYGNSSANTVPVAPFPPNMFLDWFAGKDITIKKATNARVARDPLAPLVDMYRFPGQTDITSSQVDQLPKFGTMLGIINTESAALQADGIYNLAVPLASTLYEGTEVVAIHKNLIARGTIQGGQVVMPDAANFITKPGRDFLSGVYSVSVGFWNYIFGVYGKRTYAQFFPDRGYLVIPCDYEKDGRRIVRALVLKSGYDDSSKIDFGVSYITMNTEAMPEGFTQYLGATIVGEEIR